MTSLYSQLTIADLEHSIEIVAMMGTCSGVVSKHAARQLYEWPAILSQKGWDGIHTLHPPKTHSVSHHE